MATISHFVSTSMGKIETVVDMQNTYLGGKVGHQSDTSTKQEGWGLRARCV